MGSTDKGVFCGDRPLSWPVLGQTNCPVFLQTDIMNSHVKGYIVTKF